MYLRLGKKWLMRGERRNQERQTMEKGRMHLEITLKLRLLEQIEPTRLSGISWYRGSKTPMRPDQDRFSTIVLAIYCQQEVPS